MPKKSTEKLTDEHEPSLDYDTLPNRLSALRIACVPLVVYFMFKAATPDGSSMYGFLAALCFGIAGITDYFDGYYARVQKATTVLGKLLDPLADKFLVVSSLIMLMQLQRIDAIIVILLVCRELAITGLRAMAAAEGIVIGASKMAKWKTAMQMTAIPMLMLHKTFMEPWFAMPFDGTFFQGILGATYMQSPLLALGTVFTYISLLISLLSAKDYIVDFFNNAKNAALSRKRLKKEKRNGT